MPGWEQLEERMPELSASTRQMTSRRFHERLTLTSQHRVLTDLQEKLAQNASRIAT